MWEIVLMFVVASGSNSSRLHVESAKSISMLMPQDLILNSWSSTDYQMSHLYSLVFLCFLSIRLVPISACIITGPRHTRKFYQIPIDFTVPKHVPVLREFPQSPYASRREKQIWQYIVIFIGDPSFIGFTLENDISDTMKWKISTAIRLTLKRKRPKSIHIETMDEKQEKKKNGKNEKKEDVEKVTSISESKGMIWTSTVVGCICHVYYFSSFLWDVHSRTRRDDIASRSFDTVRDIRVIRSYTIVTERKSIPQKLKRVLLFIQCTYGKIC